MSLLENIGRINYKHEEVINLLKLYQYRGRDFYYGNVLQANMASIRKENIVKDTKALVKYLNIKIDEKRLKLLLTKKSKAKTKDEKLIKNIYQTIELAQTPGASFFLKTNEMINLQSVLFKDVKKIPLSTHKEYYQNNLLTEERNVSNRFLLDNLFMSYSGLISEENYEAVNLIVNFYIDFINSKPFAEENDLLGLFLLYNLLLREKFSILLYESFFEMLLKYEEEFHDLVIKASYDYEHNYSHTEGLTNFIVNNLIKMYKKLEDFIHKYEFDIKLNKGDNIENTINKLSQTFSKEDIRHIHPYVSDSTINRTLQRLKDDGKISPLGTGRSAMWIKNYNDDEVVKINGQIDFYKLGVVKDEK